MIKIKKNLISKTMFLFLLFLVKFSTELNSMEINPSDVIAREQEAQELEFINRYINLLVSPYEILTLWAHHFFMFNKNICNLFLEISQKTYHSDKLKSKIYEEQLILLLIKYFHQMSLSFQDLTKLLFTENYNIAKRNSLIFTIIDINKKINFLYLNHSLERYLKNKIEILYGEQAINITTDLNNIYRINNNFVMLLKHMLPKNSPTTYPLIEYPECTNDPFDHSFDNEYKPLEMFISAQLPIEFRPASISELLKMEEAHKKSYSPVYPEPKTQRFSASSSQGAPPAIEIAQLLPPDDQPMIEQDKKRENLSSLITRAISVSANRAPLKSEALLIFGLENLLITDKTKSDLSGEKKSQEENSQNEQETDKEAEPEKTEYSTNDITTVSVRTKAYRRKIVKTEQQQAILPPPSSSSSSYQTEQQIEHLNPKQLALREIDKDRELIFRLFTDIKEQLVPSDLEYKNNLITIIDKILKNCVDLKKITDRASYATRTTLQWQRVSKEILENIINIVQTFEISCYEQSRIINKVGNLRLTRDDSQYYDVLDTKEELRKNFSLFINNDDIIDQLNYSFESIRSNGLMLIREAGDSSTSKYNPEIENFLKVIDIRKAIEINPKIKHNHNSCCTIL